MLNNLTSHPLIQHIAKILPPQAELFVVGGAVRDVLLNRAITDLDLVVQNVPMANLRAALEKLGTVDVSGEQWGVLSLAIDGNTVDVALPREEIQRTGNGHYFDVHVTADPNLPIVDDLRRRDFTINAMALNARSGELTDPYHGQEDCQHRILRTVGDPAQRFAQDHSRILRCLRFATQLGCTIEPLTWEGLRTAVREAGQLRVPKRIWEQEFAKAQENLPAFHEWLRKAGVETHHAHA